LEITIVSEVIVYTTYWRDIYYILERYVDPTRDYDCIRNYCIYYIIERYVDPTRDYNRDRRLGSY